jgi:membrane protein DedA with SNARE-associated domain
VPAASVTADVTDFVTNLVGDYGLYAVFFLMLVDAVFPAASEAVMVFGGALASGALAADVVLFGTVLDPGLEAYLGIALAGTLGYVVGSIGGWAIGRYGGRPFVERHQRLFHTSPEKIERAESWFERFGDAFVLVGRVVPLVRSFVSIPAGLARMPLGRFTVLTIPGSAVWCFGLAGAGWALGAHWEDFHDAFHYVDYAVLVLALGAVGYLVYRRRMARLARRARAADTAR